MKVHEYQAKEILARYGVADAARRGDGHPGRGARDRQASSAGACVVKAQIHAGGRGKGGGVKLAKDPDEAHDARQEDPRHDARHAPDRPGGPHRPEGPRRGGARHRPRALPRHHARPRASASPSSWPRSQGGMEIEEVAAKDPRRSSRSRSTRRSGMLPFQARKLAFALGLTGDDAARRRVDVHAGALPRRTSRPTRRSPRSTRSSSRRQGDVLALDAKMNFDDNALFRHPDITELRDLDEEDPLEVEASKFGLNYIKLDGNVGCMVNGAGLAMAHDGHHQARRRRARQLPRRRRRRQRGAGQERVPHHPVRHEREGRAHQHLRRHHALRHHRRGRRRRGRRSSASRSRSSCAWRARTSTRARRSCASRASKITPADGHGRRGARRSSRRAEGG